MKKLIPILLCLLLLSSCRNSFNEVLSQASDFPATVAGLKIEKAPERIAVLSEGIHNILNKLSMSEKIVAAYSGAEGEELIKIGEEYSPDADKILTSNTEFLLTFTELEYSVMNKLSDAGVRVIVFKEPTSIEELQEIYTETATLFVGENEGESKGKDAFSEYKNKLDTLKETFSGKSFVYLKDRNLSPSSENLAEGVLEYIFGCENLTEAPTEEELSALNPDYIFLDSGVDNAFISSLSVAEKLSAVSEGRVISLYADSFSDLSTEPLGTLSDSLKTE